VFTTRILGASGSAEEVTLDAFHDIWRRAFTYGADASFSDLTYVEVAARLNPPTGTIKTRIRSV